MLFRSLDGIGPAGVIVEIVGVLPHVEVQQWCAALDGRPELKATIKAAAAGDPAAVSLSPQAIG